MACTQTLSGILLDCGSSVGGIKEAYIARYEDIIGQPTVEQDEITNITLAEGAKFKRYQFRKQTGSFTSTLTVDETAGINYVVSEINFVFTKMETKKRIEMAALSVGQLVVVVKDGNNKYWYFGYDDYVSASAGTGTSGQAKGDSNSYNLTLKDESDSYPYQLADTFVSDWLTNAVD